jgi:DNA-binding transcriptional LysR family regulator
VGNSQDVINAVADLRVDIGLIEGPCHAADIIAEPWLEDELVVFAAPDSPLLAGEVTLQRLAEAPWILREHGSGTREIVDYCCCRICRRFIWAWSWATRKRSSTRCAMAWASAAYRGG